MLTTNAVLYDLSSISYDENGNIMEVQRKGYIDPPPSGTIDDLDYTYYGNRLISVEDASTQSDATTFGDVILIMIYLTSRNGFTE